MRRVYLDHNATTPVNPEVLEAMLPFYRESFGNPSSVHGFGKGTRVAVEEAREQVAKLMNARPEEVIFTGCGTESDNMALRGVVAANRKKSCHIITSQIEHPAVLDTCKLLERSGCRVTYLPVDRYGVVEPGELAAAVSEDTVLISIMHGNNEVGTLQPVEEIGRISRARGVYFHSDAVQSLGKVPIDVEAMNLDLAAFSAHKINGPKGVGACYIRRGTRMHALITGGHQERNRRSGTENVAGIVGLGKACEIMMRDGLAFWARVKGMRDRLEAGIKESVPHIVVNGHPEQRLPNTTNISFKYVEGESLLMRLDLKGVAVSTGSACSSGSLEPSHVLQAMGIPHEVIHGSLRLSLGYGNTEEDIDYVLEVLPPIVEKMRAMSPLWEEVKV